MILKVAYDDNSEKFVKDLKRALIEYPLIELEDYHEQIFRERKKAFALKNEWGTRIAPFAILVDNDKNPVIAFYSERKECTVDNIIETLKKFIIYGSTSN